MKKNKVNTMKITMKISKIIEIIYFSCSVIALFILLSVFSFFDVYKVGFQLLNKELSAISCIGNISTTQVTHMNVFSFIIIIIYALIDCLIMGIVFQNVNSILKLAYKSTPFKIDIVKSLKEIGVMLVILPFIGLGSSLLACFISDYQIISIEFNYVMVAIGMLVICLSKYFDYGTHLENEVDGLL